MDDFEVKKGYINFSPEGFQPSTRQDGAKHHLKLGRSFVAHYPKAAHQVQDSFFIENSKKHKTSQTPFEIEVATSIFGMFSSFLSLFIMFWAFPNDFYRYLQRFEHVQLIFIQK